MSLSSYCNAIQEEQAQIIKNQEIELKKLSLEIQKQNETIERLRKTNSQLSKDFNYVRNKYFELQENK